MNYGHEWDEGHMDGESCIRTCQLCGVKLAMLRLSDLEHQRRENYLQSHCPEQVVQEVTRRVAAELKKANILPAKRRHQGR